MACLEEDIDSFEPGKCYQDKYASEHWDYTTLPEAEFASKEPIRYDCSLAREGWVPPEGIRDSKRCCGWFGLSYNKIEYRQDYLDYHTACKNEAVITFNFNSRLKP